ncbi:hypothetical protein NIIDMKKI_12970 [Mycobacterium kansasii]|uniref:Uncharacterized protein n=1 Tax=Mycobacterium kansasii TaxID=1768 RepID=A0A7G1I528_MYCKA|nr:hypothetical protein NIIDMKKI_12970 [Mycobacterium kansasii]
MKPPSGVYVSAPFAAYAIFPCAGLPKATGVRPPVAASIRSGVIVSAVPALVLRSTLPGCAPVKSDALDEQAVSAADTATVATHHLVVFAMGMI